MAELAQFVVLTHGTRDTNHSSIVGNDRIDGSFEFHNEAFWRHRVRFRVIWAMAHNEGAPRPCCRGFGSFYIRISSESLLNESLTWDALRLCVLKMTTCTKMIKNAGTRYAPWLLHFAFDAWLWTSSWRLAEARAYGCHAARFRFQEASIA